MSNIPASPSLRKTSGSSTHSTGHSPLGSPTNPSQVGLSSSKGSIAFSGSMNQTGSLKNLNSNWPMWGGPSGHSPRHSSNSSTVNTPDASQSQRENWSSSRPPSLVWEQSQGDEGIDHSQKKEAGQADPLSPAGGALTQHGRMNRTSSNFASSRSVGLSSEDEQRLKPKITINQDDVSSGLSTAASFSPKRFEAPLKESGSTPRFASVSSPTRSVSYSSSSHYPTSGGTTGHYDSGRVSSSTVEDLTAGLRGMAVGDEFGIAHQQSSAYLPPSHSRPMPSLHGVLPLRPAHLVQPHQARSVSAYPPSSDYSAYYTGPPALDYQYSYDAYRGGSDTIYASPHQAHNTPSQQNAYSGLPSLSAHGHPSGVFYDLVGAARPSTSQYYYAAPHHLMYHQSASPQSPVQLSQVSPFPPGSLHDKKREMQLALQQQLQQQQQQRQSMAYPSTALSTASPLLQTYMQPSEYAGQMAMLMQGSGMFGQSPGPHPQVLAAYQGPGRKYEPGDLSISLRSPLLDEFRANKSRKWDLKDIFGYVVEFSGDQHGSRFIQQKIETASSEEKQAIFDEIVPDSALQLIQDVFGNYVIQKLFEHGTQVQKTVLANTMEGHVLALSLQMYGCRVVQKAIEYILPEQQAAFVKELEAHALRCVKDANGNHVIQKLIERVSPDRLEFVNTFRGSVYELSTHPYGCRVLQRCFEHLSEEQTRPLLDELHKYTINLMQDQFGNYVVQFVLEHGEPQDRVQIVSKLRGQMLQMARHKFASNVCEKALVMADPENRRLLIEEIMTTKQDGVSPIVSMMKDQYANYVLQRALNVVEGDQKEILIAKVRPQLATMRRYSSAYSKHLISIERLLEKTSAQSSHSFNTTIGSASANDAEAGSTFSAP